jgi:cytochrome c oxidase subunit 2
MTDPRISVLDPAGPQAATIASLWDVFLAISIAVFVLVIAFFAVATSRGARRRQRDGDGDPLAVDPVSERRMIRGITLAGAITVATLLALLIASIRSGSALAALAGETGAVHVRVTGRSGPR